MTLPNWLRNLEKAERTQLLAALIGQAALWGTHPELRELYDALIEQ